MFSEVELGVGWRLFTGPRGRALEAFAACHLMVGYDGTSQDRGWAN